MLPAYVIEDIGARPYQEDRHCVVFDICKGYDYYAVFDGHGTEKVAVFAKLYLKEILKNELLGGSKEEDALYNCLKMFNDSVPSEIADEAGCTAVLVLRKGKTFWVANVGDSRAVMNNEEKGVSITEDHKPELERERDRIKELGGFVLNIFGVPRVMGNLALSRSLGDFRLSPYVSWVPDVFRVDFDDKNRYIIVATDGLWDVLSSQDAIDIANKHGTDPAKVCRTLLTTARQRGSGDNITVMFLSA